MEQGYFTDYYKANRRKLCAYALTLCQNRDDAEDIVQTVVLRMLRRLDSIQPYDVNSYTLVAIKNLCLTRSKSFHRKKFVYDDMAVLCHGGSIPPTVFTKIELSETMPRVGEELMKTAMGYNVREIAEIQRRAPSTIVFRIQKQMIRLTGKVWPLEYQKNKWRLVQ
jgi:DNA-directed RNA polymerase specialized sigma24 family protein